MPKFLVTGGLVEYDQAIKTMLKIVEEIQNGNEEVVWFLEHPPIYTAGTSAKESDLVNESFPVYQSTRGGQYTYHGPGQLIVYVMVDLKKRNHDVRAFVQGLETWIIQTLKKFNIQGECKPGRIGVWLDDKNKSLQNEYVHVDPLFRRDDKEVFNSYKTVSFQRRRESMNILPDEYGNKTNERKIASIGVRVTKGVTWHGLSLNVNPDLDHYHGIVPCGLTGYKMTSLKAEMVNVTVPEVIRVMQSCANTCGIW